MANMVTLLPKNACPKCGGRQYAIYESRRTGYLTDRFGEVVQYVDLGVHYSGKCLTCGKEYNDMVYMHDTFVPLTQIRKFMIEYEPANVLRSNNTDAANSAALFNPMQPSQEKGDANDKVGA